MSRRIPPNSTASRKRREGFSVGNPGISALRGPFGTVGGIIRARRRSQIWGRSRPGLRDTLPPGTMHQHGISQPFQIIPPLLCPAPCIDDLALFFTGAACGDDVSFLYSAGRMMNKWTRIKFDTQLVVHRYHPTGMSGIRVDPGSLSDRNVPWHSYLSLSMCQTDQNRSNHHRYPPSLQDLLCESPADNELPNSENLSLPLPSPCSPGQENLPYSALSAGDTVGGTGSEGL
ncbi:hypothetical protein GYMLUDRAFT_252545 [Collybiopsis luxurians FD-317 M1]|uniref:Uncharacterized protein n=1 Tax=Collybiopsis luxurians FD-317 M1 TaxID=944289 RepID=A0A0D0C017_9AGAR|nr:hypothetical protein GYMLUDRAFT_252545 [Collybiopsis luxurians FD-317 M1]